MCFSFVYYKPKRKILSIYKVEHHISATGKKEGTEYGDFLAWKALTRSGLGQGRENQSFFLPKHNTHNPFNYNHATHSGLGKLNQEDINGIKEGNFMNNTAPLPL